MIKMQESKSVGSNKYRRRNPHNGENVKMLQIQETQAQKMNRMMKVLKTSQWTFQFTVEAKSPRGFTYSASGTSGSEAFLKALGQWRREVVIPSAIKQVMTKIQDSVKKVDVFRLLKDRELVAA